MDANLNEGIDHATRKIYLCHKSGLPPRPTIDCPINGVYNMFSGVLFAGDTGPWGKVEIRSVGVTEHGVYGSSPFDGKGPTAKVRRRRVLCGEEKAGEDALCVVLCGVMWCCVVLCTSNAVWWHDTDPPSLSLSPSLSL